MKFSAEIFYTPFIKAPLIANGSGLKLFEANLLIPEDVAFILSKSRTYTPGDGKVINTARDIHTAFRLYNGRLANVPALSCSNR